MNKNPYDYYIYVCASNTGTVLMVFDFLENKMTKSSITYLIFKQFLMSRFYFTF